MTTSSITATILNLKKGLWCLHYFGDQFNFALQILSKMNKKESQNHYSPMATQKDSLKKQRTKSTGPSNKTRMMVIMKDRN